VRIDVAEDEPMTATSEDARLLVQRSTTAEVRDRGV